MTTLRPSLLLLVALACVAALAPDAEGASRNPRSKRSAWTVRHVTIQGNVAFPRNLLLDRMVTKPSWILNRVPYSPRVLEDDIGMVQAFYRNQGFLQAEARLDSVVMDSTRKRADVFLSVTENARTHIRQILFTDSSVLTIEQQQSRVKSAVGKPLISSQLEDDGQSLLLALTDRGYLDATVVPSVALDASTRDASVGFAISDGPCVSVGEVRIAGLRHVKQRAVERALTLSTGDTMSTRELARSSSRLYRTDLFSRVDVLPWKDTVGIPSVLDRADARLLDVKLTENKMFQVEAGAGYGTYDNLRASLGASYRNLFGMGKRVSLGGRLSSRVARAELGYSDPQPFGIPLSFDATGYYGHHNELPLYHANIGGVRLSLGMATQYRVAYGISFRWEDVNYLSRDTLIDSVEAKRTQSVTGTVSYDRRDDGLNPSKGVFAALRTEVAGLGSSTSRFVKATGDLRGFLPLRRWLTLSTGVTAGYARGYGQSAGQENDVPIQDRFTAGGSSGIRGFRDNMVGPLYQRIDTTTHDTVLAPLGGRVLLVLHPLEARFPIYKTLGGVVFVDGGNVWARLPDVNLSSVSWSAGTGLRLNLPLGIVRLDWGFPLRVNNTASRDWYGGVHFDIGQAF